LGFIDGFITSPVHLYNGSDVLLHAAVTPSFATDAVQVSGSSTIRTGFGAEIIGSLVFRGQSTGKLMDGTRISGGVSVRGRSSVEILGGAYGGDEPDLDVGVSLSVNGIGSRIDVHGGSFFGGWFVGGLSSMYVHGCDITINGNVVQGFLSDDTALDVVVKANGLLYFVDSCPDVVGGLEEELDTVWSSGSVG
jgi:glucose/arabinose dehydrogenase